ncbi:MAG: hybrid sensor histidine kinase/response regulator [Opitutaceae bacterium]|jgi:signal transduction histidine kinase|nr:hybrid sensor histidine kinase/response regulator [Opitutaceae bacterium]
MFTDTRPVSSSASASEKPLVLVVDDEYGPRESIAFTLSADFSVDTAERAAEALTKLRARPYAAVILDIRMPEMDGIRALEEIRKFDVDVSVIMLTGYGTLATAQQAMLGGANQYLRKPPDIHELIAAVKKNAALTIDRRRQAKMTKEALDLNSALKREISEKQPQVWQARAAVELVHDLANPLTVMIGYAGLLAEEANDISKKDPERAEKLKGYSSIVEKAAEYCHHLADNWRQTTRKTTEFAMLDIVSVVKEVRHVIFFGNSAIEIAGDDQAWVKGARFELARVFQNLFKNALEANATRVDVRVETLGDSVELTIRDNGIGMDDETVRNALRGGFSTKPSGTGLGLSICRHLLGVHGATLNLDSALGKGTTMRLVFPAVPE